jgi:maleylpyruvate isomerase
MESFHDLPIDERRLLTNRGTARYTRQLSLVDSADFREPSLLDDWDRAHLIAHVAYNAAALCNLMEWAATGVEHPMYSSSSARGEEIAFGATLIPDALRNLHDHTVARLRVAWEEAAPQDWDHEVRTAQGRTVPASETLWMRSREVWIHAVDLGVGAGFSDIPEVILATLLTEIPGKWRSGGLGAGLVLADDSSGQEIEVSPAGQDGQRTVVRGPLAALVRWATGRGGEGVTASDGTGQRRAVPEPPRWL